MPFSWANTSSDLNQSFFNGCIVFNVFYYFFSSVPSRANSLLARYSSISSLYYSSSLHDLVVFVETGFPFNILYISFCLRWISANIYLRKKQARQEVPTPVVLCLQMLHIVAFWTMAPAVQLIHLCLRYFQSSWTEFHSWSIRFL